MNRRHHYIIGILSIVLFVPWFFHATAQAATITVTNTADSGAGTLRQAITDANSGDTIEFSLTYPAITTLSSQLTIDKDLIITGPGATDLTLNGNNAVRIFLVSAGVTVSVSDLTIENARTANGTNGYYSAGGKAADGGAIYNSGNLTLTDVNMTGNRTGDGGIANGGCYQRGNGGNGGAIYSAAGSNLVLSGVTMSGNRAGKGGDTSGCFATGYRAGSGGNGGAIYSAGTLTVQQSYISDNFAGQGGNSAGYQVTNMTTPGGDGGSGGAIFMTGNNPLTINETEISGNAGGNGGWGTGGDTSIEIGYGGDGGNGGGIYINSTSTVDISRSVFRGNSGGFGAGGYDGGGGGHGGAIFNAVASMTVSDSLFDSNLAGHATKTGGGRDCHGGNGGNIFNTGQLTIENTTLTEGVAGDGAGILMGYGNEYWGGLGTGVGNGGHGGNLYHANGTLEATNVTIFKGKSGNRGAGTFDLFGAYGAGGGVYIASGSVTFFNTLISDNKLYTDTAEDVRGVVESASSHNLVRVGTGLTGISNGVAFNKIGTSGNPVEPLVGSLGNYGGFTETIPLMAGSPAIDAGENANCSLTDQRGMSRPQGSACDIGAYEFEPLTFTSVSSSVTTSSYGSSVTFTATVSENEVSAPAGTVTFKIGTNVIGTGDLSGDPATATLSTSLLTTGSHSITAEYTGEGGFSSSVSEILNHTVEKADSETLIILTFGSNPSTSGQSLTFAATVSAGATGTVDFTEGTTTFCASVLLNDGLAECSISDLSAGAHTLTASYSGDSNFNDSTGVIDQMVRLESTTSVSLISGSNPSVQGQLVTFRATVTGGATGTVDFTEDAVTYCSSVSLDGGQAQCSISSLTTGLHAVTVTYSGDDNYAGSSGEVSHTIFSEIMFVKPEGLSTGSCENWTNACNLQYALGLSLSGQEIWIAAGTYKPTTGVDRTISFQLKSGVGIYGGFAGAEADRSERDISANITILSGDIGTPGVNSDNSYHIVTNGGTTILDGFTIIDGNADGPFFPNNTGGGIYNNGTLNAMNVELTGNSAKRGGGIYSSGTLVVENSTVSDNSATDENGGGIYNTGNAVFRNSTFQGNSAAYGSGLYNALVESSLIVSNSTISDNPASILGGILNWGNLSLSNSIISGSGNEDCRNNHSIATNTRNFIQDNTCSPAFSGEELLDPAGLQDNGGPTKTIALMPGSPAINAGDDSGCEETDQRGIARAGICDIGAFESRGFILTKTGGDNQSTAFSTQFAVPLSLEVTSPFDEPVNGGKVTFTGPPGGAGISPQISIITIENGAASLVATANGIVGGPYELTVSSSGAESPENYNLTNIKANQTITFEELSSRPYGETFTVSALGGASGNPVTFSIVNGDDLATATDDNGATINLTGVGDVTVRASQAGNEYYNAAEDVDRTFTVEKANTILILESGTNPSYFGKPVIFTAAVTSGATGTVAFKDSGTDIPGCGSSALADGSAICTASSLSSGIRSITAEYGGDDNFNGSTSSILIQTVAVVLRLTDEMEAGHYSSIQDAYDEADDGDVIQLMNTPFSEVLFFDEDISVLIQGDVTRILNPQSMNIAQ